MDDVDRQSPDAAIGAETVAVHVGSCINSFGTLSKALKNPIRDFQDQIRPEDVQDEFGRFRIWSGNIGAHKTGKSSLDYRLRDASHIRQRVVSLLEGLNEILQNTTAIIMGEQVPWDCLSSDSDSDSDDDVEHPKASADGATTISAAEDKTELKQLRSSMVETVTCLFRLSMAIRSPAPHDKFMKSTNIDTSHYEEYDIKHVRQKFPKAEGYLVNRLGRAISRRRQYLKYREAHHRKLAHGFDIEDNIVQDVGTEMVPQSTVASSLPTALKGVDHIDLTEDSGSEACYSEASTATSANGTTNLRTPPLPKEAQDGRPFECLLCFMIISVRGTRSWRHHVYRDLHPFICTAEDCSTPDRLFDNRNQWFEHEKQTHRHFWQCAEGCQRTFTSKVSFKDHQQQEHQKIFTSKQLSAFMNIHESQIGSKTAIECPLCHEEYPFYPQLRRHLGKHQEQLALFALPSNLDETEEEQDEEGKANIASEGMQEAKDSDRSVSDGDSHEDGQKETPTPEEPGQPMKEAEGSTTEKRKQVIESINLPSTTVQGIINNAMSRRDQAAEQLVENIKRLQAEYELERGQRMKEAKRSIIEKLKQVMERLDLPSTTVQGVTNDEVSHPDQAIE